MSTPAQQIANAANAQLSTGPKTEDGKATVSRNSVSHGLYSGDFIRAGEERDHADLSSALLRELKPFGVLEQAMADEIRRALWRLRRCGEVESRLVRCFANETVILDPMEAVNEPSEKTQKSVDRARSQAHRLFHKCMAELRRLQAERKAAAAADTAGDAKQTQFHPVETPRSGPCPCNSGQKFKRCCGRTAPPLQKAA